jgi:cell wall-associated NlpC family hydrolase
MLNTPKGVRFGALALASLGVASGLVIVTPSRADALVPLSEVIETSPRASYISIDVNRDSVLAGGLFTVSGRVADGTEAPLAGQPVDLQRRSGDAWVTLATQPTEAAGAVSFTLTGSRTSEYRLSFGGTPALIASTSDTRTVKLRGPSSAEKAARVLEVARAQTGKWYRFGAAGPTNFDCSGLTMYAYRAVGVSLPHNANAQKAYGTRVSRSEARPGDLILFLSGSSAYHAAIYAGDGYMYDAPHAGAQVGKRKIWSSNIIFRRLV